MNKRILAVAVLVLLTAAALVSTPAPAAATNCWYSYNYCLQYYCAPDDDPCRTGCECSYYNCLGMELPNWCIY